MADSAFPAPKMPAPAIPKPGKPMRWIEAQHLAQWPRPRAVLERIAESYDAYAKWEDEHAEQRDWT